MIPVPENSELSPLFAGVVPCPPDPPLPTVIVYPEPPVAKTKLVPPTLVNKPPAPPPAQDHHLHRHRQRLLNNLQKM